jgi:beta-N-acetylhexosaminidase
MSNNIAPLMIDVSGLELTQKDKERISHPSVGGLILFSRNFESKEQVKRLIKSIRNIKENILIAVDHEGGRVQRFKKGFTHIPAMAKLGEHYDNNPQEALELAEDCGFVLAYELAEIGIDFSFTPVLDINYSTSSVIGDRAFHTQTDIISKLAQKFVEGVHRVGMKTVGKHFPGHGFVAGDSHIDKPIDSRDFVELEKDYQVFSQVDIDAIMPAHIIFPKVDDKPVGFSSIWLNDILRDKLNFKGCIFSDDLSMQGALFFEDISTRVIESLKSGCDMALICNNEQLVDEFLDKNNDLAISGKLKMMALNIKQFNQVKVEQQKDRIKELI